MSEFLDSCFMVAVLAPFVFVGWMVWNAISALI